MNFSALLQLYISDDGGDPQVRQLVEDARLSHPDLTLVYCHRPTREARKAGNLAYAVDLSSKRRQGGAPLVLLLDADMAPDPVVLQQLVPYFSCSNASLGLQKGCRINHLSPRSRP